MAFLGIKNVRISGLAACVPPGILDNKTYPYLSPEENIKFIASTGVKERRQVETGVTTSDLCFKSAQRLIEKLGWDRDEIDALVFVSQTPDYIIPISASILQDRLGLSQECLTFDIPLGCSGYVYGLATLSNLLSSGSLRKALLLVGDTITQITNKKDKSTDPLFGDAGSATALEYFKGAPEMFFHLGSDGSGYKAIYIPDGGAKARFSAESLIERKRDEGIIRSDRDLFLDGMDVFAFGIDKAPFTTRALMKHIGKDIQDVDYFVFHQANRFMNEKIRKKLEVPPDKYLYSLDKFGNTSSATIPLTLVHALGQVLENSSLDVIMCGFGVGLSWGTAFVRLDRILCSELLEY